nr:putative nucleobase-ascorbate transporter 10 [Ipomoea batatas]
MSAEEYKKFEELKPQPHAVTEQLSGVEYCVNSPPPWSEAMVLGFQHYLLTLGNIVLIPKLIVPQMGGGKVEEARVMQTLLFISGLNTLFQSIFGVRLPSVLGGSHAYLIPITTIINSRRNQMILDPHTRFLQTMRSIQGALIVASCFQVITGFIGVWRNATRFLNPLSVTPLITLTGLGLFHLGFPLYLPAWLKLRRPILDRFAVLFSVMIVWMYAAILTWSGPYKSYSDENCRIDSSHVISASSWVRVPLPFQWGVPSFNAGDVFAILSACFVASIESTGVFYATARYGSATPVPASIVSRGVGWLGVGTMLSGLFGGLTGPSATVENAGLLALTKIGSRRVAQISAAFMIFFSVFGKFGAIFASVPMPAMAALYCVFFAYVCSAGLGFLQFCNLNSFRTKFILGFSLFLGLSLPQYFREHQMVFNSGPINTHASWFNDIMSVIFTSHATVATSTALLLDRTLPGDDSKDNGTYWWQKFVVYGRDVRSDEFYKLPFKLNRFFPSY